jgi:hypothetical protein
MTKITQEERNLFNPYKNVSLIFAKKLEDKDNACIGFNSDIRFDTESFGEKNFKQNIEVSISDMVGSPLEHRNDIHPLANEVIQNCKLNLVIFTSEPERKAQSPQSISFTKKGSRCDAFLHVKAKDSAYLNTFLSAMGQSTELSIKVDLLCDDSVFSSLEHGKSIEVVVHGLSMSFNLSSLDSIMQSLN